MRCWRGGFLLTAVARRLQQTNNNNVVGLPASPLFGNSFWVMKRKQLLPLKETMVEKKCRLRLVLQQVPTAIYAQVFSLLCWRSFVAASQVCREWKHCSTLPIAWTTAMSKQGIGWVCCPETLIPKDLNFKRFAFPYGNEPDGSRALKLLPNLRGLHTLDMRNYLRWAPNPANRSWFKMYTNNLLSLKELWVTEELAELAELDELEKDKRQEKIEELYPQGFFSFQLPLERLTFELFQFENEERDAEDDEHFSKSYRERKRKRKWRKLSRLQQELLPLATHLVSLDTVWYRYEEDIKEDDSPDVPPSTVKESHVPWYHLLRDKKQLTSLALRSRKDGDSGWDTVFLAVPEIGERLVTLVLEAPSPIHQQPWWSGFRKLNNKLLPNLKRLELINWNAINTKSVTTPGQFSFHTLKVRWSDVLTVQNQQKELKSLIQWSNKLVQLELHPVSWEWEWEWEKSDVLEFLSGLKRKHLTVLFAKSTQAKSWFGGLASVAQQSWVIRNTGTMVTLNRIKQCSSS